MSTCYSVTNTEKQRTAKVKRVEDEYRVRLYLEGKAYPPADYYTDDLEDAKGTARHMVNHSMTS
jgi:hypothetical protein